MSSKIFTMKTLIGRYNSMTKDQQKCIKPKGKNEHIFFEFVENEKELLDIVSKIPGAEVEHSEAALGYSFELKDGSVLTIGQSDEDVTEKHVVWFKHFIPIIKENND